MQDDRESGRKWDTPDPDAARVDSTSRHSVALLPRRIAALYAIGGALWILFSDLVLGFVIGSDGQTPVQAQMLKGWAFVLITAVSLYLIIQHLSAKITATADALRHADSKFKDFAESASDWLWESDHEHRVTYVSPRFREITGLDPGEYVGRMREELFAPLAGPDVRKKHKDDLEAHRPFRNLFYEHIDGFGKRRWWRISGKPCYTADGKFAGYRGLGADSTTEYEAFLARDRLASVVEATPDLVGTASYDGRILFLNPAGRRLLGLGADEDISQLRFDDVLSQGTLQRLRAEAIPSAIAKGVWTGDMQLQTRGGREIPVSQVVLVQKESDGRVAYVSTVARDLSRQKSAEERMRVTQRMEALGHLTGGIAHDFNNLLAVIIGNAEILRDKTDIDARNRGLADMILRAGERGADLTHRLLSFSRQQSLQPEIINVNDLIANFEPLVARTLGETITIRTVLAKDLWPTNVDQAELETCLLNLAVNARDAMPDGGTLTIETANVELDVEYISTHPDVAPGAYVVIAVSDTGTGIEPSVLGRVFDPFFTTKPPGHGTGLGLSMVFGFATQSGGHASVYSELGHGTTFKVYLPRSLPADETAALPPKSEVPRGNGERILIAEDEPLVRSFLMEQLLSLGYTVDSVGSGPDALAFLEAHPDVQLLFTDVVMPGGISGPELGARARKRLPRLKLLYTTGYAQHASVDLASIDPSIPVLSKPYRRAELARHVKSALAEGP